MSGGRTMIDAGGVSAYSTDIIGWKQGVDFFNVPRSELRKLTQHVNDNCPSPAFTTGVRGAAPPPIGGRA